MRSFSILNRDRETYDRTREIMGLPDDLEWNDIQVSFGLDAIGRVTMTFLATGEQIAQLAELARQETGE